MFPCWSSCTKQTPVITAIDPRIGMMGEVLTIHGENFGEDRDESYVTIAGAPPTASSYIEWSDNRISVRVPEFGDSGLVYVYTGKEKSNAALFSNRATMPHSVRGPAVGIGPRILSIEPSAGAIGSAVTILGQNFGSSREGSRIFFAWDAEAGPAAPAEVARPSQVAVSETDFGYELWNEREIRIRVPDGAISGNVEIKTPRGNSMPVFFDVSGKPGSKTFKDKRSYAISYSVDIKVQESSGQNSLYLWMPLPETSASQKEAQLLARSMEPFIENHQGSALFRFSNLQNEAAARVTLSYLVEVYAVETDIRPQSIRQTGNSALHTAYTAAAPLIPSNDPEITEQSARITGRERNPYLKAQRIYDWLIKDMEIQREPLEGGALEALASGQADAYQGALLFCSLARASGIPALPVSGILVDRSRAIGRHYWAEFWIDGLGWIPVDPALGSGAFSDVMNTRQDRAAYYFGNIDSQRITFSRGQAQLSQMDSRGRTVSRDRGYALQNVWEEAVGSLESYSSLWSDIIITGVYAH
ncbi:IPT/TIG domain-containing protein [Breznakiella homolactica]|uniref:IPT/TIG domain-containing protein n=2 Tax=Breznakiella homolactica TaxID=2798577 RepID=A0A7T8BC95_9SPIR|nr:IPT/TIG domain-containing protein [Breznakiella homolactica]